MKSLIDWRLWVTGFTASIVASALSVFLPAILPGTQNSLFHITASFAIVILVVLLFQLAMDAAIERSKFIRRLLLGEDFLEGWWVDYAENEARELVSAALLCIKYRKNELKVQGSVMHKEDHVIGRLTGYPVAYSEKESTIAFSYRIQSAKHSSLIDEGYEELKFDGSESFHDSYNGFVFLKTERSILWIVGRRLTKKECAQMRGDSQKATFLREQFDSWRGSTAAERENG
jgi:hypothetical protein